MKARIYFNNTFVNRNIFQYNGEFITDSFQVLEYVLQIRFLFGIILQKKAFCCNNIAPILGLNLL